jgi:hypothetical protein
VILALVLLAGCGGGDLTTALTKAEFVKQGNQICDKGLQEREEEKIEAIVKAMEEASCASGTGVAASAVLVRGSLI